MYSYSKNQFVFKKFFKKKIIRYFSTNAFVFIKRIIFSKISKLLKKRIFFFFKESVVAGGAVLHALHCAIVTKRELSWMAKLSI